jgi:hypothetical protein
MWQGLFKNFHSIGQLLAVNVCEEFSKLVCHISELVGLQCIFGN